MSNEKKNFGPKFKSNGPKSGPKLNFKGKLYSKLEKVALSQVYYIIFP